MGEKRAKLFSTDPPYAVDYEGGSHPQSKTNNPNVANKDWSADYREASPLEDGKQFYAAFVGIAIEHAITERAAWYCWHASRRQAMLESVWEDAGAFVHQQIIWMKSRPVLTHSAYMWQHEPCLMGWIKGKKPLTRTGNLEFKTTIWEVPNKEIDSADHPTSKPTSLFRVPMEAHTSPKDIVYEPFSGSGTQIIAAEMIQRICFALEISPQFVDVAVQRWQTYTGQEATLEATGETYSQVAEKRLNAPAKPAGKRKGVS
jgi:DNA modification methylase